MAFSFARHPPTLRSLTSLGPSQKAGRAMGDLKGCRRHLGAALHPPERGFQKAVSNRSPASPPYPVGSSQPLLSNKPMRDVGLRRLHLSRSAQRGWAKS